MKIYISDIVQYIQNETGYVIKGIYSVDSKTNLKNAINLKKNASVIVSCFVNAKETAGFSKYSVNEFLFTYTLFMPSLFRYIRSEKLKKLLTPSKV